MGFRVNVVCDKCGCGFGWNNVAIGKTFATNLARERGWSVGKKWICRACKEDEKKRKIKNG